MEANFCAEYPTLIVRNLDQPGCVATVTTLLSMLGINIATLQLYRDSRGGDAVMVVECDREVPRESIMLLEQQDVQLPFSNCVARSAATTSSSFVPIL